MSAKSVLVDGFGWGFLLWLFGYVLAFALFFVVPPQMLGWIVMPVGFALTYWVLRTKVTLPDLSTRLALSVIWTVLAAALDYVMILKLLNPADGYYKLDVYIYYGLTFMLPLTVRRRPASLQDTAHK